jgi:hypothetical protein
MPRGEAFQARVARFAAHSEDDFWLGAYQGFLRRASLSIMHALHSSAYYRASKRLFLTILQLLRAIGLVTTAHGSLHCRWLGLITEGLVAAAKWGSLGAVSNQANGCNLRLTGD